MKYYVTADTHGFYSVLREALEKAGYFDDREERKLIILGDLAIGGGRRPLMR